MKTAWSCKLNEVQWALIAGALQVIKNFGLDTVFNTFNPLSISKQARFIGLIVFYNFQSFFASLDDLVFVVAAWFAELDPLFFRILATLESVYS